MAACSDLELEEKSSEERLPRSVRTEDAMSQSANLNTCNEVISSYRIPENSPQPEEQSETGDLNKLSDDEFLHLLEEASTFNKPNNQESVLLKQLRKEVAETDPCDNVSRTKPARVSDGSHSKRSKHPSGYCKNRESGLVRSVVTDSDTVSLPQRTLDYNVRRKNEKLGRSREYPHIKNNALLTTSGLGKSGHQSQSLQDLVNSDLVKSSSHSYRKLQRAQRAASFSSAPEDQDSELEFESLRTSFKSSKRTKQQMHSSASFGAVSELANDKNKTPSSSKHEAEEAKSRNRRLSTSEIQDSNVSSLPLTTNSDPMDSPSQADKENIIAPESPNDSQEIEMKDISSVTVVEESPSDSQSAKGDQQSSSKFYVNYSDVDSTVPFPLKLVSTNGEINKSGLVNEAMNDTLTCQQVNFPMPWTRPMQVHSFLSSLPTDHEAYPKKEKQIFGSDVNGNPFAKTSRTANITSFVSATLLDYPGSNAMVSDNQTAKLDWSHRKNKRTRNNVESRNVLFSENIAGHRGKESIEALLKFINSDDSKTKSSKGSNSNQSITNKSAITHESDKKKIMGKGLKNCHNKNIINTAKKKMPSPLNSEEECVPSHEPKLEVTTDSENLPLDDSRPEPKDVKGAETPDCINLDVNSNITTDSGKEKLEKEEEVSSLLRSPVKPVSSVSPKENTSISDAHIAGESQGRQEEEDFLEVKKKQRRRHVGKRNESYRWHSAVARANQSASDTRDYYVTCTTEKSQNRGNMHMLLPGMQLPQRNQSGKKQDSRRKSTSSVPHSEQSSADNSDLDSVHSLPVKGSARHPTQPQPHTSPSSSSSTPQASYADIAKMPVSSSKPSPPPFCESLSADVSKSNKDTDREHCKAVSVPSETVSQSKTAQTQTPAVFVKSSPSGTVESEPSVSCARTSSYTAKSTRERNTQTDLVAEQCLQQDDKPKDKNSVGSRQVQDASVVHSRNFSRSHAAAEDGKPCNICHNTCNCNLKSDKNIPKGQRVSKNKRPAVIMRNDHVASNVSGISFGVNIKELCSSDESLNEHERHTASSVDSSSHCASLPSSISVVIQGEQSNSESVSTELPASTSAIVFSGSETETGLQASASSPPEGFPHRMPSPRKVTLRNGQICVFSGQSQEVQGHKRTVDYLISSFESVMKTARYWTE